MPAIPPLESTAELREYINDWVRNDATPAFQALRMNTILISMADYIDEVIVTGGGEPTIAAGTTNQYWRGDKTWQTLNKAAVGLGNVQNVDQTNATNLTSGTIAAGRFGAGTIPVSAIDATGTADSTTVLFGDGTWGTVNVTDGDKGDITVDGTSWTINDDAITLSKLPEIAANRVLGRTSSGTGDIEQLTGTQITGLLDIFTSTHAGIVPASGGGTTNYLRADGTWADPGGGGGGVSDADYGDIVVSSGGATWTIDALSVTNSKINDVAWSKITGTPTTVAGYGITDAVSLTGTQTLTNKTLTSPVINVTGDSTGDVYYRNGSGLFTRLAIGSSGQVLTVSGGLPVWAASALGDGDKGDITVSSSGSVWTIDNTAVTLAKIQNISTASFIGRATSGSGVPEVLSGTQATELLDVFTTSAKGLVPDASGGATTTQFLRKDGTWAVPSGTGFTVAGTATEGYVVTAVSGVPTWQAVAGGQFTLTGSDIYNSNAGNVMIGTSTSTGDKLRVLGSVRLDIGSDDEGDMFYRDATGSLARIAAPTGLTTPMLSYGTEPEWVEAPTGGTSTTINNNAATRIITGSGTANTLNGEAGLTFDTYTVQINAPNDAGTANNGSYRLSDGNITPSVISTTVGFSPSLGTNVIGIIAGASPSNGGSGGMAFSGFTNTTTTALPLVFAGYHGSTAPTTPALYFRGAKWNGTTSAVVLGNTELLAGFYNFTTKVFEINGIGAIGLTGSYGTAGQVLTSQGSGTAPNWTTVSGGGGETLDQTLTLGKTTAQGITFTGSGTDRGLEFINTNRSDNLAGMRIYPTGTNAAGAIELFPKGTGGSATLKSLINLWNTDFTTDGTNYGLLAIRAAGTNGYGIYTTAAGTGVNYPIWLSAVNSATPSNANLTLNTSGSVSFRNYTFPLADGTANYVLKTNGSGTVSWAAESGGTATTINNNANNRIVTGSGTANTLEAESSFTYDASIALLQITSAAGQNPIFRLQDADLTIPDFTAVFTGIGTTAIAHIGTASTSTGGLNFSGLTTNTAGALGVVVAGYLGHTSPTGSALYFRGAKHNGTTGATTLAASEKVAAFHSYTTEVFTIYGTGGIGLNGSMGTSGQVLTSGGSGAAATWTTVGNMLLNATNTMGSSGKINFGATATQDLTVGNFGIAGTSSRVFLWQNRNDAGNYRATAPAFCLEMDGSGGTGVFRFHMAASGTAGNPVTTLEALIITPTVIHQQADSYHTWGSVTGSSGYGIRDNGGVIEYKHSGGSWTPLP